MSCTECTKNCMNELVATWAGVPVGIITPSTQLNGLGGKSWPEDSGPLVSDINTVCGVQVNPATIGTVEDLYDAAGVPDDEEKE